MRHLSERGSALFYILIAIALLAALSYAIARSSRGNVGQLSDEQSRLAATEIVQYADTLSSATGQLRLRGFDATEISFENDVISGYTNANCTEDACKIFKVGGGGVIYNKPSPDWNDGSDWYITMAACVQQIGTGGSIGESCNTVGDGAKDLILFLPNVAKSVCVQINKFLGVTNPGDEPPLDKNASYTISDPLKWTGSIPAGAAIGSNLSTDESYYLNGKSAACFEAQTTPTANSYHFYKVLIAR